MNDLDIARKRCLDLILNLSMKSEVPAVSLDPTSRGVKGIELEGDMNVLEASKVRDQLVGIGRPSGGDRDGKLTAEEVRDRRTFAMQSAERFRRRAMGCRTAEDFDAVSVDVQRSIDAWEKTPLSGEPRVGDSQFPRHLKRAVEENLQQPESQRKTDQQLAWHYGCDRTYVNRIRLDIQRAA